MTAQETVYKAIEARGYIGDWTRLELIGRHLLKLVEETGELAETMSTTTPLFIRYNLDRAAADSKFLFDLAKKETWYGLDIDEDGLRKKLADVVVVCLSLAQVIGFDVVEAAVQKATADVERGVRGKQ